MSAPVRHTCPQIDKAIALVHEVANETCQHEDLNVHYELKCIIDYFEDLRKANDLLRTWGEEQEDRADKLDDIVTDLENQLFVLTNKVEDLESENKEPSAIICHRDEELKSIIVEPIK